MYIQLANIIYCVRKKKMLVWDVKRSNVWVVQEASDFYSFSLFVERNISILFEIRM